MGTGRLPALGSSPPVATKVRMWFPVLWRPQKMSFLASSMLDLEISTGLEPEGRQRGRGQIPWSPHTFPGLPLPSGPVHLPTGPSLGGDHRQRPLAVPPP